MSVATAPRSTSRLDRLVARILDRDGTLYGDEQERLRYYESSTVVASLQGILVPWTLVVGALVGGLQVAAVVVAVAVVYYVPWLVGATYVRRRRVRTTPARFGRSWVALAALTAAPYPLLLVIVAAQYVAAHPSGAARGFLGGAVGGIAGATAVAVLALARKRRAEHEGATVPDVEDDE
ncbi:MAG TPA: hypothetical protein VE781_15195 [Kineosporiaceae bacterium]|jgi:hypothetical protein|nr:hypothetical protein [Kineosporiaceae bacterium]